MIEELLVKFVPVLVAALVGGFIGIEREYRDKSAGFRTMILISVGACLFTILSDIIGGPDKESSRIAASVVTGVGFLGAGVVLKDGVTVRGLTTAASIWLTASLGMAAGMGEYELAGAVALFVMIVLCMFPPLERWIDSLYEFIDIEISVKNTDEAEDDILDIFDECKIRVVRIGRSREDKTERKLYIKARMTSAKRKILSEILVNEKGVLKFKV